VRSRLAAGFQVAVSFFSFFYHGTILLSLDMLLNYTRSENHFCLYSSRCEENWLGGNDFCTSSGGWTLTIYASPHLPPR